MATSAIAGLVLVLVSNVVLALSRVARRMRLAALCISALAGFELGLGYGLPHGEEGLRKIAGGAIFGLLLSFVCALCIGLVQLVGILTRRQAAETSAFVPLVTAVAMPGVLYCAEMLGVAVRERLLHW